MTKEKFCNPHETVFVNGVTFTHEDIFRVVDDFYTRIQHDPVLQIPFQSVEDWPEHVQRLTHFWWIRFGGEPYLSAMYSPVSKHFFAGFNRDLLTHWLTLFHDTLKTHLKADQIALWKLVSERMGEALTMKNEFFRRDHESKNAGGDR